ncbi:hypothetical protein R1sor_021100 [Riccia sorocarpa]|uniref:Uncharacterized protein n=1 Tax=Riccia sorocarpa TaxID=122646 RepID=A0ABD3GKA5_9MARC
MTCKVSRYTYKDLLKKTKSRFQLSVDWLLTLSIKDAALALWKHSSPTPVPCGLILMVIPTKDTSIELLCHKGKSKYVRYVCMPKQMDRKESVAALGHGLMSAKTSQIGGMIEKFITYAKNFKLLEHEAIKEALEAGVFGDIDGDPNLYLPHPEIGLKKKPAAPVVVEDDEESMDEQDFFKEVTAGQAETARLWEENKKKGVKGKEKIVPTAPSKKSDNNPPAPKEKLLGSSIRAESARLTREAEKLPRKRPHVAKKIAFIPPPSAAPAPAPVDPEFSSGDDEQSSSGNESSEAEPLSDAPGSRLLVHILVITTSS